MTGVCAEPGYRAARHRCAVVDAVVVVAADFRLPAEASPSRCEAVGTGKSTRTAAARSVAVALPLALAAVVAAAPFHAVGEKFAFKKIRRGCGEESARSRREGDEEEEEVREMMKSRIDD